MAVRPPAPATQTASPFRFIFLLGLLVLAVGVVLLMLSFQQRDLRVAGAVCLLLGVVLTGGYLTSRLFSGMYADPLAYEPPWAKLGRGEGPPRLPAPGKPAAPPRTPVAIEKLIDFPEPAAPRRPPMPPMSAGKVAASPAPVTTPVTRWTAELFDRMSPQQFDMVCHTLFAQSGLETRVQSHGAAGGVTIWLHSRNAQQGKDSPVAVAVCKLWPGQPLAVREIHPLLVLMTARQLKRATYATASSFTENAREFAKRNGINALDRFGLLALIATRTPVQQQVLLAVALGKR
ncbi:MAG: restriction endonuclease [Polaromonas sp.]|uniref:restriction endonuclease n=1 Tax=Polaromonas sp. TaxID=1869339 RepID=UPI002732B27F|nr:restriction endonuclease [Polaromonas sp.]MDP2818616.1 restriction endonuclease [Polaromonas sp.]